FARPVSTIKTKELVVSELGYGARKYPIFKESDVLSNHASQGKEGIGPLSGVGGGSIEDRHPPLQLFVQPVAAAPGAEGESPSSQGKRFDGAGGVEVTSHFRVLLRRPPRGAFDQPGFDFFHLGEQFRVFSRKGSEDTNFACDQRIELPRPSA